MNWSNDTVDALLETVLPLKNKRKFERALSRFAEDYEIGDADTRRGKRMVRDGDPVRRFLWGICTGSRNYFAGKGRTRRAGEFTWVEQWMLKTAAESLATPIKEQKFLPTPHYMAKVLRRSLAEVEEAMRRLGPAKGRAGFGFGSFESGTT